MSFAREEADCRQQAATLAVPVPLQPTLPSSLHLLSHSGGGCVVRGHLAGGNSPNPSSLPPPAPNLPLLAVEVDVWAAGIWLVALLCGAFPFDNRPGADDTAAEMQIL